MLRIDRSDSSSSWVLAAMGPAAAGAAVADRLGVFPRLGRAAEAVAGLLGPALATYTGTLVADTAVPVWHEAGRELPFVFAGSAAGRARLAEREHEQLQQIGADRDDWEDSKGFA